MAAEDIHDKRERVLHSYQEAVILNRQLFRKGDDKATAEYVFPNQKEDAQNIVNIFYTSKVRVVSIQKKTKVGADGLMIEIAKLLTTHNDDTFIVDLDKVRIITGMSNAGWEKDMIDKAPYCFKDKIFHHGKLSNAELREMRDGLIIIDEIDTGDKERQVLHRTLKEAGVLNVEHIVSHNIRFVFISATMIKELYDLYQWGDLHALYSMTIPPSYIGHKEFLEKGILKEFYPLNTAEEAERWIQEDILDNYGDEKRVHIVRVTTKTVDIVQNACIRKGIRFINHTSDDRLTEKDIKELFKEALNQHIVLGVKGLLRRANLIPNSWKLRIGATHELYTTKVDYNVQIQGLPGRMTGYWRDAIEGGHKTGPYRTSIAAIQAYEAVYCDPFGKNSYQSGGFTKKKGKISAENTLFTPKNIENLNPTKIPLVNSGEFERGHMVFDTQEKNEEYAKKFGAKRVSSYTTDENGFKMCSTTSLKVHSLEEIFKFTTTANEGSNMDKKLSDLKVGECAYRRYVCYRDIRDKSTECFVTIWVKRLKEASD